MYQKNLKAYKTNILEAEMSVADPHRVIQLMMNGLLERLAMAKGAIDRKDYEAKAVAISKAQAIINGLQDSIDMTQGEISERLYALYDYMKQRVIDASVNMDKQPLDEVANLMITIKIAWDKIPDEEKQKAYEMREQQQGQL
jgi:flagellar protein FliS